VVSVNRAWIRGVGVISALAPDWPGTAAALARGASGITPITRFDTTGMPCSVAATVADDWLDRRDGVDRRVALAGAAAREAWSMAGVTVAPDRLGLFVGAESGLACFPAAYDLARAAGTGSRLDPARLRADPDAALRWADPRRTSPPAVAWAIARELGPRGPCRTVSLACASGAAAILEAVRALRAGACDAAVCVGVGADVDPLMLAAFGRLGALSARGRAAAFDAARDGFVLGEGAAALVLSVDRGDALVEVAGGARSLDGGSLTAPDPDSRGAQRAITGAIADAATSGPTRMGYVAAHGTATLMGDAIEAAALRAVLGDRLGGARVGAVKSALGHWIAGAGALAAVCAWHAVAHGELLPTIGVGCIGPDCVLPHVLGEATHARIDAALVDSFGFGGANACLVLRSAA
jgi:3-oxoacyl-[acyl-carrier-protein] synthase II